jgi:antitoxin VapB
MNGATDGATEVKWEQRIGQRLIRRLYDSEARGLLDEALLDDVGTRFCMRCEAVLAVSEAMRGRVRLPAVCAGRGGPRGSPLEGMEHPATVTVGDGGATRGGHYTMVEFLHHVEYALGDGGDTMAMNIKNPTVERLAAEVATLAGETKTQAVKRALEERKQRLVVSAAPERRGLRLRRFLAEEVWPAVPRRERGRRLTKAEEESILGYGRAGA